MFARMHFETARVADILEEAGVTQGAFYFHFGGGKIQVAEELIRRQDNQFIVLRDAAFQDELDALSALLKLSEELGKLLQADPLAQAGIRLVTQASSVFPDSARLPDPAWTDAIAALLYRASGEGTLRKDVEVPQAARAIVYLFTGAQVSSYVNDAWAGLPDALRSVESFVLRSLAVEDYQPVRVPA